MQPRLLDLFCGQGGAGMGYSRAGFEVVGVDHRLQPHYPFKFHHADALEFAEKRGREFDVIHASPPCQRYSQATRINGNAEAHPDLVPPTRELLKRLLRIYVIENVPGAPLLHPILICGLALRLGVKRHRLFESNVLLFGTDCPVGHRGDYLSVFGHDVAMKVGGKGWVSVHGGGAPAKADSRRRASSDLARKAMGIDWMTRDGLSQAIPPAYTEYLGKQLIRIVRNTIGLGLVHKG